MSAAFSAIAVTAALLLIAIAVVSSVSWYHVEGALSDSESAREVALAANARASDRLWGALVSEARAIRMSGRPGQHTDAIIAIKQALKLPLPLPGKIGRALWNGALTADHADVLGTITFADWLEAQHA